MEIGDILIEWSYVVGWGRENKRFTKHTVTKITPTGRIKTDRGLELNPNLTIRGNGYFYNRSYISLFTDEIKEEIENQKQKDALNSRINKLDINQLTPKEVALLNEVFKQITERS